MSIQNAIPSVWAHDILQDLDSMCVYAAPSIINNNYEGLIKAQGDTVRITTLGNVTVKPFTRGVAIDAPESLTDAQLTLRITQSDYFNFEHENIDAVQAEPDLYAEATRTAARGMRYAVDSFIASHYIYAGISGTTYGLGDDTTPLTGFGSTNTAAHDLLVDMSTRLDDTETPEDGRFVVVPPWFVGRLEKDPRYTSFGTPDNLRILQQGMTTLPNGLVGQAAGFNVYKSTRVPNTTATKYKIIAGHNIAWSRAMQLVKVVAYNPESAFQDALKGLQVYGAKVLRPSNLAVATANNA